MARQRLEKPGTLAVIAYLKVPVLDENLRKELCHPLQGEVLIVLEDSQTAITVQGPSGNRHQVAGYVKVLTSTGIVGMIYRDSISILQKV